MAQSRADALRAELAGLSAAVKQVQGKKKLEKRKVQRRHQRRPDGITAVTARLVAAVFALSNYDADLAAKVLLSHGVADWPVKDLDRAKRTVEDAFLRQPDDFAATMQTPPDNNHVTRRLAETARRLIGEAKTRDWVQKQNVDHGVAPSSLSARAYFDTVYKDGDRGDAFMSPKHARQWARRWGRRWGVKHGRVHRQEPLDREAITAKEPWIEIQKGNDRFCVFYVSICRPSFGPVFRADFLIPQKETGPKVGPYSGPVFKPAFVSFFDIFLVFSLGQSAFSYCQVRAYWQWIRYTEARVPAGKRLLLMNLDETSVSCAPVLGHGLVVARTAKEVRSLVSKQDSRTNFTYTAVVCDNAAMQHLMPHFIITSTNQVTAAQQQALRESSQTHVHFMCNGQGTKKAWNNTTFMQRMLSTISAAVSHRTDLQPVLILDAATCHLSMPVMLKARALGIWLIFVPAGITCLVQPLDTHAFASFKAWLRAQFTRLQGLAAGGVVSRVSWLRVLQTAKKEFFDQRQWAKSFQDTGARRPVARLTTELQKYVELSAVREVQPTQPDASTLSLVWPRNRRMAYAHACLFKEPPHTTSESTVAQLPGQKRPRPAAPVSIALASRALKRSCRQRPTRDVD